jgi:hypothetical protein
MSEEILQANCYRWHIETYPDDYRLIFHVPNGGYRGKREAGRLKSIGVTPGVSDFIFLQKGHAYFIEMKAETGKQSAEQKNFENKVKANLFDYFVVNSLETYQELIKNLKTK